MLTATKMASSKIANMGPMVVFDPFKPEDYDAMFEKHAWTDRSEVDIDQYLTPEERRDMCDYEKDRLRNIKKNYDVMIDMGLPADKPYFMQKNRPTFYQPVDDSSESDSEWVPAKNKPRPKKPVVAGWKPPVKKAAAAPSVKPAKVAAKGKRSNTKTKKKPSATSSKKTAPAEAQGELTDSDGEDGDFDGFSVTDVEQSEARGAEVVSRNDKILADIEAGTYSFNLSDDEEESESDVSEAAAASPVVTEVEKPAAEPDRPGRYPRRSIARKVYTEPEVPKDDDYLYCEDCDQDYEGDCPVHGPLLIIHDTKVANDGSDPDRADHSLPQGLVVRKSQIPLAGDGVWAEQAVCKNARFGPYRGVVQEDTDEAHKSGYCWLIYEDGNRVSHYVDARDKSQANWLRYVNCARNEGEQNLLAYQYHGEVYYRTVQEILPGRELLVWYGDEFGRELGLLPRGGEDGDRQQTIQLGQAALQKLFHDAGFSLWMCEVCECVFPSEMWRDAHRRQHGDRTGSKKYKCTQCNFSTDRSADYNRHLLTHSGARPHTCKVCGKGFTLLGSLTVHERTHTGVRPYTCPVCNKGFTQAAHLQTHSRIHTGEKPYSCPLCAYGCTESGKLTTHMRTHTGEQPYVCTTCGQGFRESQKLRYHSYTHTGLWPHTCSVCQKGFAQAGKLRRHTEAAHGH